MQPNGAERARARGFTLIEVLAALVIVALGMLGVIEAVTQSARNGTYLREKTLAHWIAMNVVTEQRLQAAAPDVGDRSGEVDFAGSHWKWSMHVTQTQVDSMRRMDVSVRAADAPENSTLALVTGFYSTVIGAAGGGSVAWEGSGTEGAGQTPAGQTPVPAGQSGGAGTPPANPVPTPPPVGAITEE